MTTILLPKSQQSNEYAPAPSTPDDEKTMTTNRLPARSRIPYSRETKTAAHAPITAAYGSNSPRMRKMAKMMQKVSAPCTGQRDGPEIVRLPATATRRTSNANPCRPSGKVAKSLCTPQRNFIHTEIRAPSEPLLAVLSRGAF